MNKRPLYHFKCDRQRDCNENNLLSVFTTTDRENWTLFKKLIAGGIKALIPTISGPSCEVWALPRKLSLAFWALTSKTCAPKLHFHVIRHYICFWHCTNRFVFNISLFKWLPFFCQFLSGDQSHIKYGVTCHFCVTQKIDN